MLKENKGITLIALVITIIVLLILAGVSIAMIGGDEGLLKKAQEADTSTAKAKLIDAVTLATAQVQMDYKGAWSFQADEATKYISDFADAIADNYYGANRDKTSQKVTISGTSKLTITAADDTTVYATVENGILTNVSLTSN